MKKNWDFKKDYLWIFIPKKEVYNVYNYVLNCSHKKTLNLQAKLIPLEKIHFKKPEIMKIDILLVGPNLKYSHWPARAFSNIIEWMEKNWHKHKTVSWHTLSVLNFFYIFFTKNIFVMSVPEKFLLLLVTIFPFKKFIIWADIEFRNIEVSSKIYAKKNVLKTFNTKEIQEYYSEKYTKGLGNPPYVLGHWIDTNIWELQQESNEIFVYYKNINNHSLEKTKSMYHKVKKELDALNIKYSTVEYGNYDYDEWTHCLEKSSLWIFITSIEGYCLAKLEALNHNVPILNFEQHEWLTIRWEILKNRSTFPIFESWFWELFYDIEEFRQKLTLMKTKKYTPRNIVIEKYDYIKKSEELMNLFKRIKV